MSKAACSSSKITRRAAIAATLAGVGAPTITSAALADPIYAAIDAHHRAYDDVLAVLAVQDALDDALRRTNELACPAVEARLKDLRRTEGRLGRIEIGTIDRFVKTIPQMLAGAAAALRYVREHFEQGYPLCEEDEYMPCSPRPNVRCAVRPGCRYPSCEP
jgi:hypothetical protein